MKKINQLLSLLISVSLILSTFAVSLAFEDLSSHWAKDAINKLMADGIISGDSNGSVNPDNSILRSEFIKIVNRTFGYTNKATLNFPDVNSTDWYYNEFLVAKENGYLSGDQNGNASPTSQITRAEVCVILARILKLDVTDTSYGFSDSDSVASWAKGSIAALNKAGFIKGYEDGSFRPNQTISRAEAFYVVYKIIEKNLPKEETPAKSEAEMGNTGGLSIISPSGSSKPSSGGGNGSSQTSNKTLSEPVIRTIDGDEIVYWESVKNAVSYDVKISLNKETVYKRDILGLSEDISDAIKTLCENAFDENVTIKVAVKANANSKYIDSDYSVSKSLDKYIYDGIPLIDLNLKLNYEIAENNQEKYSVSFTGPVKKVAIKTRTEMNSKFNVTDTVDLSPYLKMEAGVIQAEAYAVTISTEEGIQTISFNTGYAGGAGTKEDPYKIGSLRHFNNIYKNVSAHYIQIADIDTGENFTSIYEKAGNTAFTGSYIGQLGENGERTEIKLNITNGKQYSSVFGVVSGATIKNLKISGVITTTEENKKNSDYYKDLGSIAGASLGNSIIDNCENTANIFGGGSNTGGILGSATEKDMISNCINSGNIETNFIKAGGIVGITLNNTVVVSDCVNYGSIKSNLDVTKAIAGDMTYHALGGIVGQNAGRISNCVNEETAVITGEQALGGIAGYNSSNDAAINVSNCINKGKMIYTPLSEKPATVNLFVGGIVGYHRSGSVINCINEATAEIKLTAINGTGLVMLGGITGYTFSDMVVDGCVNKGTLTGEPTNQYAFIAGITAYNFGNISNCSNLSSTLSSRQIGGIVGRGDAGKISNCYNLGDLPNTSGYKGGIASASKGIIENCFNLGEARGLHSGGITGTNLNGTIKNCYTVVKGNSINAITDVFGTQTNVYYVLMSGVSITDLSTGGTAVTKDRLLELPTGIDAANGWRILLVEGENQFTLPQLIANPYYGKFVL